MDAARFDELLRKLHGTATRRLTIGGLATLGLAALLGEDAQKAVAKKKKKAGGKKGGKKKKKVRIPAGTCRFSSDCNGNPDGPCCNGSLGVCRKCTINPPCGCAPGQFCSEGSDESLCIIFK